MNRFRSTSITFAHNLSKFLAANSSQLFGSHRAHFSSKPPVLKAKSVKNKRRVEDHEMLKADRNIRKDLQRHLAENDLQPLELMDEDFQSAFQNTAQEYEHLHHKIKTSKMAKKHFGRYIAKEVNLLTYAEKEHIRYLHKTDPQEWDCLALSEAFPISSQGVMKLIKSAFKLYDAKSIEAHDRQVASRIKDLSSRKHELSPELRERILLRENLQFVIGEVPQNQLESFNPKPQKLGPFRKLVMTAEKIQETQQKNLVLKEREKFKIISKKQPVHGDIATLIPADKTYSRKNRGHPPLPMDAVLSKEDNPLSSHFMQNNEVIETSDQNVDVAQDQTEAELENYLYFEKIKKYKYSSASDLTDSYSVSADMECPQVEKAPEDEKPIHIPSNMRTPGAIYKVGNAYYDEDGEFLYKVA